MEEPNAAQSNLDYIRYCGRMNSSNLMEIGNVATPSCYGNRHSYNYFSSECKACSVVHGCTGKIEIDDLLADLPGEDENSLQQDSSGTHGRVQENPTFDEGVTRAARASAVSLVEMPAKVAPAYAFPVPDGRRYIDYTNDALVGELRALIRRGELTASSRHYDSVRKEICAIHIEMNLRQQHAPRFRPQPPLPKKAKSIGEQNLARDRQVVDIHWRAHSNNKPMVPVSDFEDIFDSDSFDFGLAGRFAQLEWRLQIKVIHLHLTEDMQWEHAIIQNPNIRDNLRTILRGDVRGGIVRQAGAPQVQTLLHQSMADAPHLRKHIPGLMQIWIARRIVGDSPRGVARFAALITGEGVKDASAVRRAMATLDKRLASAKALHRKP